LKSSNAAKKIDQSPLTIFADNSQLQLLPLPKMPIRLTPLKRPQLSLDTFRALCAATTEFGSLAPWEYMCDTTLFGIQDTGKVRLGSVLGNDGEPSPSGLFVHRGELGLRWVMAMVFGGQQNNDDPNFVYGDDALLAEIVAHNKLEQHDIDLLSQIGFQPLVHSQRAWPKFRSYRPGAIPWFLEQAEADLLLSDLRVAIAFVRLVAGKKDLYDNRADNEVPFCPKNATDAMRIEDLDWQKLVLPPEPLPVPVSLSASELAALHALPQDARLSLELDCLYSPGGVDEEPRPHFLWMGVVVDARKGVLLDSAMGNSQTQKAEQVAARCLLQAMTKLKCRPKEILMSRTGLAFALEPITRSLGIRTSHLAKLKGIDRIYRRMIRSMDLNRC
jgi:hypothetical protein